MKRILIPLLLLATCVFAQDVPFAQAMDVAPVNGKLVILSSDGEIVGLSQNLSRDRLEILVSPDFSGTGTLLVTTADGGVLFEFAVAIHRGAVTVDDEPLTSLLETSGFHVTTVVAGEGLAGETEPDRAPLDPSVPTPPLPGPTVPPIDDDVGGPEEGNDDAEENSDVGVAPDVDATDQDPDAEESAPETGESTGDASDAVDGLNPAGTP